MRFLATLAIIAAVRLSTETDENMPTTFDEFWKKYNTDGDNDLDMKEVKAFIKENFPKAD